MKTAMDYDNIIPSPSAPYYILQETDLNEIIKQKEFTNHKHFTHLLAAHRFIIDSSFKSDEYFLTRVPVNGGEWDLYY